MALFGAALGHMGNLDVYLTARRLKPWSLPVEVRRHAIECALVGADIAERVRLLGNEAGGQSLFAIDPARYSYLVCGADIANKFTHEFETELPPFQQVERDFFYSIQKLFSLGTS
jgi:hypothetical protein